MKNTILILIILLSSCNPVKQYERQKKRAERKIEVYTKKFPELKQKDTITVVDTFNVVTETIKHDTSFIEGVNDTVVLTKDKLTIRYYKVKDTVYLNGECESDTIEVVNEVRVPVEKIVIKKEYPNWFSWLIKLRPLWFIALFFLVAILISRKFVN